MTLAYEGSGEEYNIILEKISVVCTIIFIIEAVLKLTAFGFEEYFYDNWNKFDFFVVATGLIDIIFVTSSLNNLNVGGLFKIFQVIRIFRIIRVIR